MYTPVKKSKTYNPRTMVFRGGSDFRSSANYKKYNIAFFARKIQDAKAYTYSGINISNKYYMYELKEPLDSNKFLTDTNIMEFIKSEKAYGTDQQPYNVNMKRDSKDATADYEFFVKVRNKFGGIGIITGTEVILFEDIVEETYEVEFYDILDETVKHLKF